jgi:N6-adenosine-specific RNA methylase IME4
MTWPFGDLPPLSFDLLYVDAPWSFQLYSDKGQQKSPQAHYSCMSLDGIKALPVSHLAAPDCLLFMWATFPMLPEALEVMKAWCFTYKTGGAWQKMTSGGKRAFGVGYRLRSSVEPFLIGTIGNPKTSRAHRNSIAGPVREHSRKPEEAYRWLETYMPRARRAELFARERRAGWSSWGDQLGKFDSAGTVLARSEG